tara:strand:+ start:262 stop:1101 length:840 start_codon:yes stop_codon:yes gene_type:complete
MRILITGGTGFIGKKLIIKFTENNYKFAVLTRNKKLNREKFIYLDKNLKNASKKILKFKPTIIVHLATNFQKKHTLDMIPKMIEGNISFGSKILELLKNKIDLFVNVNSAYTSLNGKAYDPKDFYSSTKYGFEIILSYFNKYFNFKVVNLLLADTYGPNDKRVKLINILLKKNKSLRINNPNDEVNYTYIDDIVDALNLTVNYKWKKKWNNFSIFSNESIKICNLIKKIEKIKKNSIKFISNKNIKKNFKFKPRYKKLINWKNKTSLKKGISLCLKSNI